MGKPFEVEIDCGTGRPVRFELTEEAIRDHRAIEVRAAIGDDTGDPNERVRLWRGALEVVRRLIERNASDPIRVFNGPDVWMIPDHAVRTVRLRDPESPESKGAGTIGFRSRDESAGDTPQ